MLMKQMTTLSLVWERQTNWKIGTQSLRSKGNLVPMIAGTPQGSFFMHFWRMSF